MTPVTIRFGNLLTPGVGPGGGLAPDRLDGDLAERFAAATSVLYDRRQAGELGFLDLPGDTALARGVREVADSFGQWFEDLVVVGIGGSSLGAKAIFEALRGAHWNELAGEARDHFPRIHFLENADPDTTVALLGRLDPRRTLVNVVSKSGGTAETMAQYLVVEEWLREGVGDEAARGHLLFTTDPEQGALRQLAGERAIPALPVPPNVGGRFSVLSPAGLLPAAVAGVEVEEVLEGAGIMARRCEESTLRRNPAGLLAVLLHAADRDLGRPTHVFMPYGDRLRAFALWFQQLWAESLGKRVAGEGTTGRGVGPTPLAALGAVDQHSLLQLLMEGPEDKLVVFLRVRTRSGRVTIPPTHTHLPALAYLGGHTLQTLLDTELRATVEALRRAGRPSLVLEVESLDARTMGELFMLFQLTTVLAGALYGVDPLDQPGVELGKELTSGLLGREGYPRPELADDEEWVL